MISKHPTCVFLIRPKHCTSSYVSIIMSNKFAHVLFIITSNNALGHVFVLSLFQRIDAHAAVPLFQTIELVVPAM